MILKNSINNMIHKLHLDEFIKSQKELLNDNKGGFLLPIEAKLSEDGKSLVFKSDKFSTYALAYEDTVSVANDESN